MVEGQIWICLVIFAKVLIHLPINLKSRWTHTKTNVEASLHDPKKQSRNQADQKMSNVRTCILKSTLSASMTIELGQYNNHKRYSSTLSFPALQHYFLPRKILAMSFLEVILLYPDQTQSLLFNKLVTWTLNVSNSCTTGHYDLTRRFSTFQWIKV